MVYSSRANKGSLVVAVVVSETVPGIFAQMAGMQVYVESGEPSHDVTGEQTMRG